MQQVRVVDTSALHGPAATASEPVLQGAADGGIEPARQLLDAPGQAPGPEEIGPERALPEPITKAAPEIRGIICQYSWPCSEALAVVYGPTPPNPRAPGGCANGESGGNPLALSTGGHRGLFQLWAGHAWRFERHGWTWDDAFDAERNVAVAYELWSETRSWAAWSCSP